MKLPAMRQTIEMWRTRTQERFSGGSKLNAAVVADGYSRLRGDFAAGFTVAGPIRGSAWRNHSGETKPQT